MYNKLYHYSYYYLVINNNYYNNHIPIIIVGYRSILEIYNRTLLLDNSQYCFTISGYC